MKGTVGGRGLWTAGQRHSVHQIACQSSEGTAYSDGTGSLPSSGVARKLSAVARGTAGIVAVVAAGAEAADQKDLCLPWA